MYYVFEIPLPDHVRFCSLYLKYDGTWSLTIAGKYELLNPSGSSLGGIVATGHAGTVEEARVEALGKLMAKLEEARDRPAVPLPVLGKKARSASAFSDKSVDDILAQIMGNPRG